MDQLAEKFLRQEVDNASMAVSLGKLSKEVEKVETEVYDLQGQLDKLEHSKLRQDDSKGRDTQKVMKDLEEKLIKTRAALKEAKNDATSLRTQLTNVIKIVESIAVQKLRLDLMGEYGDMLFGDDGSRGQITEDNLRAIMGIIEMRVTEAVM